MSLPCLRLASGFARLSFVLVVACAAFAVDAASSAPAFAQDAALENARKEFERGGDLFEKGDFQNAADAFMAAYKAKAFPAFVFNAAVCYEKLKDYKQAVELFKRYLAEDPKASDKNDVEKRIKTLEDELARAAAAPPPDPNAPPTAAPALALPEVKTKSVVVITSKPDGASIYLDDKKNGSIGETPWNGSIEGSHTVIIESKGYKTEKKKIQPSPDKLYDLYFALSTEQYLGWLEVKANVPGSDVYIDTKEVGAVGKTPWMGNVQPGKRKIWVTKEGYTEYAGEITIVAGKPHNVNVKLEEAAVGFVKIRVNETGTGARVSLDNKRVCDAAPCRFQSPEGTHTVGVARDGKKTLLKSVTVVRKTETTLSVKLAPSPSHADAFWPFLFSAGLAGGGYFLGKKADDEPATTTSKDAMGNDVTKKNGTKDLYRYGSYGVYGLAGVAFVTGCYYLFRDKGPPSTATQDARDLSWAPAVGPGFAGVAASMSW
jgi:hypothetical protein